MNAPPKAHIVPDIESVAYPESAANFLLWFGQTYDLSSVIVELRDGQLCEYRFERLLSQAGSQKTIETSTELATAFVPDQWLTFDIGEEAEAAIDEHRLTLSFCISSIASWAGELQGDADNYTGILSWVEEDGEYVIGFGPNGFVG